MPWQIHGNRPIPARRKRRPDLPKLLPSPQHPMQQHSNPSAFTPLDSPELHVGMSIPRTASSGWGLGKRRCGVAGFLG